MARTTTTATITPTMMGTLLFGDGAGAKSGAACEITYPDDVETILCRAVFSGQLRSWAASLTADTSEPVVLSGVSVNCTFTVTELVVGDLVVSEI